MKFLNIYHRIPLVYFLFVWRKINKKFLLRLVDPPFSFVYKENLHHIDWLGGLNFPGGKPSLLATYVHCMPSSNKGVLVFLPNLYRSQNHVQTLDIFLYKFLRKEM